MVDDTGDGGLGLVRALVQHHAEHASGMVEVRAAGVPSLLYLVDGVPVFAEAGSLGETLGRVLLREGKLDQEQYAAIVHHMTEQLVDSEQMRFGEAAVALGFLSPTEVTAGLERQVQRKILACIAPRDVSFHFIPSETLLDHVGHFPCALEPLLVEGLRRDFDAPRLMPVLASGLQHYLRLQGRASDIGEALQLTPAEVRALRTVDGEATTLELLAPGRMGSLESDDVVKLMATLVLLERAELLARPPSARAPRPRRGTPARPIREVREDGGPVDDAPPERRERRAPDTTAVAEPAKDARAEREARPARRKATASGPERPRRPAEAATKPAKPATPAKPKPAKVPDPRPRGSYDAAARLRAKQLARLAGATRPSAPEPPASAKPRFRPSVVAKRRRFLAEKAFRAARRHLDRGQWEPAEKELRKAVQLEDDSTEYALCLSWARFRGARAPSEKAALREELDERVKAALRHDREMAYAHYVRAHLYLLDENEAKALRGFRRAADLDPELFDAQRHARLLAMRKK
ncbi:MAG TPA: hypothetical protein RMG95_25200 [Polyangiaceae bacterium LLY-WYZ-15_(1-7)]|nr:hypothetical protein [Polyangiaceae bacterium LLY-WYZ-15_(1-7)]